LGKRREGRKSVEIFKRGECYFQAHWGKGISKLRGKNKKENQMSRIKGGRRGKVVGTPDAGSLGGEAQRSRGLLRSFLAGEKLETVS